VNPRWRHISRSQTLDAVALSAQAARAFVAAICADAEMPEQATETALLLVSEVVTNAISHGDGQPVIDIDVQPDRMRVSVTDEAEDSPRVQHPEALTEHGRGMFLVESLASRWGISRQVPTGKSVWFELDRA
jgi:anti-sigma regulatory factor (Ser/Thr protein kinase)